MATLTTVVEKFQDGTEVPQAGFEPFSGGGGGGGATIPDTTNLISGDGSGNGADSGIDPAAVAVTGGDLGAGSPSTVASCLGGNWIPEEFFGVNGGVGFSNQAEDASLGCGIGAPNRPTTTNAIYVNVTGTPGTAISPGTLIYKTTNGGTTWTAIL